MNYDYNEMVATALAREPYHKHVVCRVLDAAGVPELLAENARLRNTLRAMEKAAASALNVSGEVPR